MAVPPVLFNCMFKDAIASIKKLLEIIHIGACFTYINRIICKVRGLGQFQIEKKVYLLEDACFYIDS